MQDHLRVSVIGLGYVGLPLAVGLARHYPVVGFDVDARRVAEIKAGHDRTREVEEQALRASTMTVSGEPAAMKGSDVFIVTVPTPVDGANQPDLGAVRAACRTVGGVLGRGAVVVFESTVYPGVTEDLCGPALEQASGLKCGADFFLGYSPERINPGDRLHTVDRIVKVVAGQTPAVAETLARLYGRLTAGGVFVARSIKTAEAAKVIENAQRDINIAFVNEVAQIFSKLGVSVFDVLEAAGTKWNFLPFSPGLVGGHCIGVDPFYLAACAQALGHHPEVILAGRRINDGMGAFIAGRIADQLAGAFPDGGAEVLVLGITFKENVPDLRNSKVVDLIRTLEARGHRLTVHDPLADPEEAKAVYGLDLVPSLDGRGPVDCVVGAVPHDVYQAFTDETFARLLKPGGLMADVKGMWRRLTLADGYRRWSL
jgi:UDP-N-acetyl-D-galactosamine dehydrogenase